MVFLENQYVTITYEPENKLAYTQWHQFAPSDEYRNVLNHYILLVKQQPVTRWIGNTKKARAIRPADQEWTVTEWLPKFAQCSLKRMAIIISEDIFNKMAIDTIYRQGAGKVKFETHYFDNEAAARKWVMEIE